MTFGAFMAVYRSAFSRYIYYFLSSGFFREIFQTDGISTQINKLTQAMIKNALIPLPPLAEQQRIVMAIEVAFEQLDIIAANLK
jgi:type I restriction enzyme S subunit